MIIHIHEQRTAAWYRARIGIPTASSFHKVMMGRDTKGRQDYMCRLIMERILQRSLDEGERSKWMTHGTKTEAEAIAEFCAVTGMKTEPVGFISADNERYGCSLDAMVCDTPAAVEVKCPAPWTHCRYMIFSPGNDYKPQVQGQLLITDFETIYFFSYFPGLPHVLVETKRDEKYIKTLEKELKLFCDELDEKTCYVEGSGKIDLNRALYVLAELMPEI